MSIGPPLAGDSMLGRDVHLRCARCGITDAADEERVSGGSIRQAGGNPWERCCGTAPEVTTSSCRACGRREADALGGWR